VIAARRTAARTYCPFPDCGEPQYEWPGRGGAVACCHGHGLPHVGEAASVPVSRRVPMQLRRYSAAADAHRYMNEVFERLPSSWPAVR
jgi:hypothetical protein